MRDSYVTEASFRVYVDYLALKRHFATDSYDYHKYNGKVRASFESFQTRNDAFYFHKLSQKQDNRNLMIANIVKNPNIWIRELCEEAAEEIYLGWKKKIDGLTYHVKADLKQLNENYKENFVVQSGGQYPLLLSLYLKKLITLETFSILSNLSNVFPYWNDEIVDKIVARDIIRLSQKYYPFLAIDKKKFQNLIKEHFF